MLEDFSLGIRLKEPILTHEAFEKRIRSMIKAKSLTDLELKRLLLNSEVKFVKMSNNRNLSFPSVSIVLPVFNDEDIVISCLETLFRQTYQNVLEIIVVDDGSMDDSLKILKEFENIHPLVRVIESNHLGRSTARNIGLRDVKGEIVLFAESDAMYAPWYLEKAVEQYIIKNADAVMLQGSWILNSSIISKCILVLDQIKWGKISVGKKKVESAWVFKTEVVKQVAGFDEKLESGEDKDLMKRIIFEDARIEYGTGYNWFHPTPTSLKKHLKRILDEQRKKAAQHCKKKEISHQFLVMILLIVACLLITFSRQVQGLILYFFPYIFLASFFIFYVIRLSYLLKERKNVSYRMYLFILPFISILAIFPKIIGTILGKCSR